jgi:hypothetical protein
MHDVPFATTRLTIAVFLLRHDGNISVVNQWCEGMGESRSCVG